MPATADRASTLAYEGATVRNKHTGSEVIVEAVGGRPKRFRLSCDAKGKPADVGWTAAALDEHWDHVR